MKLPIRVAVVGARRGRSFIDSAQRHGNDLKLLAVCDPNEERLAEWRAEGGIRCYTDYQQVLEDDDIDAVCIATPLTLHAKQAIAALEAGKHVLSEVPAAFEIEDGWALIEAVERTGKTYMLAENYCFMRPSMMVLEMVDRGIFGDITFAEGSYIHDCRTLNFDEQGDLTWRGQLRHTYGANTYPTHSLGPVARWLGINRTDRLKTTATWQSRVGSIMKYAGQHFPERNEYQDLAFWPHSDTVTTVIRTENGVLIQNRIDWASARPHQMKLYGLQGTTAAFASQISPDDEPLIWIEGKSPTSDAGTALAWEPLYKYANEFEHPLWRAHGEEATHAGHSGGDYFILKEFTSAVIEGRPPLIDVYDAVTWSSIAPLSRISVANENASVEVPDFTKPRSSSSQSDIR